MRFFRVLFFIGLSSWGTALQAQQNSLQELLKAAPDARTAVLKKLQESPNVSLQEIAAAMGKADAVQKNALLAVAHQVLNRDPKNAIPQMNAILENKSLDPTIRYWAFTRITGNSVEKRNAMLNTMLDDPALPLRYEAVKHAMAEVVAKKEKGASDEESKKSYQELLVKARLPEQIQEIADALKKFDVEVDLLKHFGFVANWKVIASFDNHDQKGFPVVYGPEEAYEKTGKIDEAKQYNGKAGMVGWQPLTTDAKDGAVDLNPVFKNEKGAVAYAYAEFPVGQAIDCEVRLGCINANKVWVNGKLVFANEVYHTGMQIDQYSGAVQLKPGVNTVLVKVCQNEQTEQWAQDWKFQLRFSDASGLAIRSSK